MASSQQSLGRQCIDSRQNDDRGRGRDTVHRGGRDRDDFRTPIRDRSPDRSGYRGGSPGRGRGGSPGHGDYRRRSRSRSGSPPMRYRNDDRGGGRSSPRRYNNGDHNHNISVQKTPERPDPVTELNKIRVKRCTEKKKKENAALIAKVAELTLQVATLTKENSDLKTANNNNVKLLAVRAICEGAMSDIAVDSLAPILNSDGCALTINNQALAIRNVPTASEGIAKMLLNATMPTGTQQNQQLGSRRPKRRRKNNNDTYDTEDSSSSGDDVKDEELRTYREYSHALYRTCCAE
mmetsp:Transcript_34868/g.39803  ORF Transcript_34868/g.39803 Transcript_34868/m.39803 type:complete len:293 (-) Transcript_34868:143-1021(-)